MSEQGKQVAKAAAFIAGGAVIGAGLGLLFAPQTGAETRRDISRYARKAQVQATRWGRAVQSGVKEVMDRSRMIVKSREEKPELAAVLN
jgi:gas vesicle protein